MNDLKRIKEIEEEVAEKIKKAWQNADTSISEIKAKERKMIQEEIERAGVEVEKDIKDAEIRAKKDAERIIMDGKKRILEIQNAASKRFDNAVELIMKEFGGD